MCASYPTLLLLVLPLAPSWHAGRPSLPSARASPTLASASEDARTGHCFVLQGDLRLITADAVLYPTRNIRSPKWFPRGPPEGVRPVPPSDFTPEHRVHRAPGVPRAGEPAVWLGWLYWEDDESPPIDWFISAAEQYLQGAYAASRGAAPLCDRELPIFALPVVGTGRSGGRAGTGQLLSALLLLLTRFCATHAADVVLVTKGRRMFSAAQSSRQRLEAAMPSLPRSLPAVSSWSALGPRLLEEAQRLAKLGRSGQLVLFMGSGTAQTNDMPGWSDLLSELALQYIEGFRHADLLQLRSLALKDQAFVLQHRLGKQALGRRAREAAAEAAQAVYTAGDADAASPERRRAAASEAAQAAAGVASAPSIDEVQHVGRAELQRLAVARLSTERYSVTHALLATLPHSAVVTTNSDTCYDTACAAAGIPVTVLPYESRGRETEERWLLKLHGDVEHPEDIVLTYSGATPYGYEREALSGIVQALLITKHMCFVGFSLTDDAFNQVAATVRRALQPTEPTGRAASRAKTEAKWGSALTISDRPFMAELWPELEAVPMGAGIAEGSARARRKRRLEILLDRTCMLTTDTSTHLLDPKFEGAFTAADLELQGEIGALLADLQADGTLTQRGEAFAAVRDMLRQLGMPTSMLDRPPEPGEEVPVEAPAPAPDVWG